ncbi:hypothetical protein [Lonepinella sp. BR2357]|uniref:hypothetical protein n=1 Tax=Lonepinella sp. BR2357 TaxID=3434549 RepID=UPI003F6DDBB8
MNTKIFESLKNNQDGGYYITKKVNFSPLGVISENALKDTFEFSFNMTFGEQGEHRGHRTGGIHNRRKGEIFANTFQGKLAEFAVFEHFSRKNIEVSKPDLGVWELGTWDDFDLLVGDLTVSIKSTKSFGNLLLLEKDDWDENARYKPNNKSYDFTFLVRTYPFCEELMKNNRILYSDVIKIEQLREIIFGVEWKFDIPGYVTRVDLIQIIKNKQIIPQGSMLNGSTKMDASNYYIQAGDLRKFK